MPSWPWTFATLPAGNVAASKLDDNFNAAVLNGGSSTNGAVPTWNGTGGNALNSGGLVVGTGANNLVQLNGSSVLPSGVFGSQSITNNGYTTLGGTGLIMQWGLSGGVAPVGTLTVTFPLTFPTAVYSVVITAYFATSGPDANNYISDVTLSQFTIHNQNGTGSGSFYWLAFGS